MEINENTIQVTGYLTENFTFSFESYGEKFYKSYVSVRRLSGEKDIIPIIVSEKLNVKDFEENEYVRILGNIRTQNIYDGDKSHLQIYVFVKTIIKDMYDTDTDDEHIYQDTNIVTLEGYICKKPCYRLTPFNREICDMLLAVNRRYNKSDYIPCIAWGRNAKYSSNLEISDKVSLRGRFQSRKYLKNEEEHIAYEISVEKLNKLEEDNETV